MNKKALFVAIFFLTLATLPFYYGTSHAAWTLRGYW